ncbi:unnamed protein product [Lota lota]
MDKVDNFESEPSTQHLISQSQWPVRMEPWENTRSAPITLPSPYVSNPRNSQLFTSPRLKPAAPAGAREGRGGRPGRNGPSNHDDRRTRPSTGTSRWDPQTKKTNHLSESQFQDRRFGERSLDGSNRALRGPRSAPGSARSHTGPPLASRVTFEVKMADFPSLAVTTPGTAASPALSWGPKPQSQGPHSQGPHSQGAHSQGPHSQGSHSQGPHSQGPHSQGPHSQGPHSQGPASAVASWANVASQPPPRKPVPGDDPAAGAQEEREDGSSERKRRKRRKKKTPRSSEEEPEEPQLLQEPPKFEDEEEFPDLGRPSLGSCRLTQPCSQKSEKATGKKSKVPLQLDIGTMLEVLERKHQSQKSKHDAKPVFLSVGGALPVGPKQPAGQKKGAWQQDKIAHNPLDSTSPMVKKGKQREVPKAKKPTQLKRVILKEREERKQTRLLQERGLDPQHESRPDESRPDESRPDCTPSPTLPEEEQPAADSDAEEGREEEEEEEEEEPEEQPTVEPPSHPTPHNPPKIHSRKFRDYCSQVLSKDVDECVSALLRELVRFQDRLYQKDPMKARIKKRLVMGLREVLKHLRLGKVKCVVISPNCERSQSKGGLDEALHTIIDTCRERAVPFVFALSRKALGRCVNKAVPVSLVGIFNYDGAQDFYHQMIELSSEARKAYEEMLERVEVMEQTEEVEEENPGQQRLRPGAAPPPPPQVEEVEEVEEPEYIKLWKKMLENDCNHQFLNFEEQLGSLRLDGEELRDADQQS